MDASAAQRVFLLAYDPDRRKPTTPGNLGTTLQAAALLALYRRGTIEDRSGRAHASARRAPAPSCELEAALLTRITASERPRAWKDWIRKDQGRAADAIRDVLVRERVCGVERRRVLGVFPAQRITLREPRPREAAARAVEEALRPGRAVDRVPDDDAALVALVYEGGLTGVLGGEDRRAAKARARAFGARFGPIPAALRQTRRDRAYEQQSNGS